jgi:hypothetical protein
MVDLPFYGKCSLIDTLASEPMTDKRDLVPRFVPTSVTSCRGSYRAMSCGAKATARRAAAERPRLFRQARPRDIFERCRTESMTRRLLG